MQEEVIKISKVLENYIEIIYCEEQSQGAARASTIAEKANVSRSTVTSALKNLKTMGYVEYEPYSLIHLTEDGKKIGRDLNHRHDIFKDFFQNVLQLPANEADDVACELEHVVPLEATRRLGQFLVFLKSKGEFTESWQAEYKLLRRQALKDAEKQENDKMKKAIKDNEEIETIKKYL